VWVSLAVVAADRVTKYAIERFTSESFRRDIVPKVIVLVHSVNPGIAFGLLSESASKWVALTLMVMSGAVIVLLAFLLVTASAGDAVTETGFALIAGGAAGNLIDRVLYGGVTDFLELHAGRFQWPAFNLADSAITVGAFLVAIALLRGRQHPRHERA
jgi:signal peptidase II